MPGFEREPARHVLPFKESPPNLENQGSPDPRSTNALLREQGEEGKVQQLQPNVTVDADSNSQEVDAPFLLATF